MSRLHFLPTHHISKNLKIPFTNRKLFWTDIDKKDILFHIVTWKGQKQREGCFSISKVQTETIANNKVDPVSKKNKTKQNSQNIL